MSLPGRHPSPEADGVGCGWCSCAQAVHRCRGFGKDDSGSLSLQAPSSSQGSAVPWPEDLSPPPSSMEKGTGLRGPGTTREHCQVEVLPPRYCRRPALRCYTDGLNREGSPQSEKDDGTYDGEGSCRDLEAGVMDITSGNCQVCSTAAPRAWQDLPCLVTHRHGPGNQLAPHGTDQRAGDQLNSLATFVS